MKMSDSMSDEIQKDVVLSINDQSHTKLGMSETVSRLFVKYPCACFSGAWAFIILVSLVTAQLGFFDVKELGINDWLIAETDESNTAEALDYARNISDFSTKVDAIPARSDIDSLASFQIIYEWTDASRTESILTPANLQAMCQFENTITGSAQFPKFCKPATGSLANGTSTSCFTDPLDIVSAFYSTGAARSACILLDTVAFNVFLEALVNGPNRFFLTLQENYAYTRSQVSLGGPLGADSTISGKAYSKIDFDQTSDQFKSYNGFIVDEIEPKLLSYLGRENKFGRTAYQGGAAQLPGVEIRVRFRSQYLESAEFPRMLESDQLLVGTTIIFVGVCMYWYVGSLFITVTGMFAILFSVPFSLFIYSGLFGIEYFTNIHIVTVFLILGVGADGIFVFVDAWKQSDDSWRAVLDVEDPDEAEKLNRYGTGSSHTEVLIARLSYTYSRAVVAIFNTSVTTCGAFLATGVSPVTPVAAFGYFAGIAMMINFLWALILYPSVITVHEKYFYKKPFICACFRSKSDPIEDETLSQNPNTDSKFFTNVFIPFLEYGVESKFGKIKIVSIIFSCMFLAFSITMGSFAIQLETPAETDNSFASGHMFTGFVDYFSKQFLVGADESSYMSVTYAFGIEGMDRNGFKTFEPNGYRGVGILQDNFELASEISQQYLLDVCQGLENFPCVAQGETEKLEGCSGDYLVPAATVQCFLKDFHSWHNASYGSLETVALKLGDENKTLWTQRLFEFAEVYVEYQPSIGFIDDELRFVSIKFRTSLKAFSPAQVKGPVIDILVDHLETLQENAPPGLESIGQTSFDMRWIHTELGLVTGMFQGVAISFGIAYIVLLLATGNLIISALALLAILGIVLTVLGTVYLLGWALGIGEAIAAVMVIGLSVDYVIHLGHMYVVAGQEGIESRQGRFRFSATKMGPTIIAGSVTTGGSALTMFLCQLAFFTKMATLIVMTIASSIAFSLFFFLPMLLLLGPEKNYAQWTEWFKCSRHKIPSHKDDL